MVTTRLLDLHPQVWTSHSLTRIAFACDDGSHLTLRPCVCDNAPPDSTSSYNNVGYSYGGGKGNKAAGVPGIADLDQNLLALLSSGSEEERYGLGLHHGRHLHILDCLSSLVWS